MAGCVRNSWAGRLVATDWLVPHTSGSRIQAGAMAISDATVIDMTITGTFIMTAPYVPGPDIHVWMPFGPVPVVGPATTDVITFPMGAGTWLVHASIAGTGTLLSTFAHFTIEATVISDGNTLSIPTGSVQSSRECRDSTVMTAANTYVTFVGVTDGDGYSNLAVRITSPVHSNWSGYIMCVGSPVST